MTVGELALLFNNEYLSSHPELSGLANKKVDLQVIKMQGWTRDMFYEDTGLKWVLTSPNMPTIDTTMVYPGMGMIEGTTISEGRGITKPFEIIGANFIKDVPMKNWVDGLNALNLPGVIFRPQYFTPQGKQKMADTMCGGIEVHVTDRKSFRAIPTGIAVLCSLRDNFPADFTLTTNNYIDSLTGSSTLRNLLNSGANYQTIVQSYQDQLAQFLTIRNKYLLY
ncbi:hypothetical protein BB558_007187 [Smittium angustum]|nr:hypothetical protein BB558_007187 [Smittium angustum]